MPDMEGLHILMKAVEPDMEGKGPEDIRQRRKLTRELEQGGQKPDYRRFCVERRKLDGIGLNDTERNLGHIDTWREAQNKIGIVKPEERRENVTFKRAVDIMSVWIRRHALNDTKTAPIHTQFLGVTDSEKFETILPLDMARGD